MVGGWDDGDEPWNDHRYFDIRLREPERRRQWDIARSGYMTRTGKDTTLNSDLFPDVAERLRIQETARIANERRKRIEDQDCFVATAVYGDREAPEVQALRRFRDEVLMDSPFGRACVDFYYGGFGKGAADFIRTWVPSSIPFIRKGLDYIARRYGSE